MIRVSPHLLLLLCVTASGCTTFTREADTAAVASSDAPSGDPDSAAGDATGDAVGPADVADAGATDAPTPDAAPDAGADALGDTAPDAAPTDSVEPPDTAPSDVADAPDPDAADAADAADVAMPDAGDVDVDPCPSEPCVTPGLHVCTPDAAPVVLVCEPGQDGCLTWSVVETCADGLDCQGGACGADACAASGEVECVPGGYRICASGADGFLAWGPVHACPPGQTCKGDGACGSDGCPVAGQLACYGVAQRIVCEQDADGFLSWSAPVKCGDGEVCKGAGVCGVDGCPFEGLPQCIDDATWQICEPGPDGFLQWSEPLACEPGCVDGVGCGDACVPGAKACSGAASAVTCVETPTGPTWGEPTPCPTQQVCKGAGACGKDLCLVPGTRVCSTQDGNQTLVCTLEPSGFLKYAPGEVCEPGQVCKGAGVCGVDACQAGAVECLDGASLRSCELGASGFLDWSAPIPCPAGSFCLGATGCVPEAPVTLNVGADDPLSTPAAAALGGGATVVAWTRALSGSTGVLVRTVDGAVNPMGGLETLVTPGDLGAAQREPAVAGSPDGSYLVAWTSDPGGATSIRATVLGGASSGPGSVSAPGGENAHPAAAAVPGGGYLVVWESTGAPCASARCLLQRRLGPDGSPTTAVAVAFDGSGKQQLIHPSVGVTPNGGAWLVARRLTEKSASCFSFFPCPEEPCCKDADVVQTVVGIGLASDGDVTVPPVTLETSSASSLGSPAVAVQPVTGVARLAWAGDPSLGFNKGGIRFGCLDPTGQGCGPVTVSKGGGAFPTRARLAAQDDGSYVAAWASPPSSGAPSAVYTRRVSSEGAALADPSQASLGIAGDHGSPVIVRRSDGVAALVWITDHNGVHTVRMRLVKPQ